MSAGELLLRAAAEAGYYGVMSKLFGAQVRGGEAAALVEISTEPVTFPPERFDLFVALDWQQVDQFASEIPLDDKTIIIADPQSGPTPASIAKSGAKTIAFSMANANATPLERALQGKHTNVFAAGAVAAVAGLPVAGLHAALATVLGGKSDRAVKTNSAALDGGIAAAAALDLDLRLLPPHPTPRWLMTGNQALAVGALRGGVRFVGCYPITPATDLVEWLSPQLAETRRPADNGRGRASRDQHGARRVLWWRAGDDSDVRAGSVADGRVHRTGYCCGDSRGHHRRHARRSVDRYSFQDRAERRQYRDLRRSWRCAANRGGTDVGARLHVYRRMGGLPCGVVADPGHCAVRHALGQTLTVIDPKPERPRPLKRRTELPDGPFKRYAIGSDPVTSMPRPGHRAGQWVGEGLTHNEIGIPVGGAGAHAAQLAKRAQKFAQFDPGPLWGDFWGEGDTAIVTFGSGIGAAQETARRLGALGHPTRVVALRVLSPLPVKPLAGALEGARRIVVMEQNHSAQLYHHLLAHKAIPPSAESLARPGPLPFRPTELTAHLA